jgi:hypothetical protein
MSYQGQWWGLLDCNRCLIQWPVGSSLEQFKDIFFQENSIMHMENQQFTIDTDLIQSVRNGQPATSHTIFEVFVQSHVHILGWETVSASCLAPVFVVSVGDLIRLIFHHHLEGVCHSDHYDDLAIGLLLFAGQMLWNHHILGGWGWHSHSQFHVSLLLLEPTL